MSRFTIPDLPNFHATLRQSIHNPFQADRMPKVSFLELQYPTFFHSLRQNLRYLLRRLARLALVLVVLTILEYFVFRYRPAPYFHAVCGIAALAAFFFSYLYPLSRWELWFGWAFLFPVLAVLLFAFPSPLLLSLTAVLALWLLSDAIASNYFYLKTAAPVLKPTSARLRSAWRRRFLPWNVQLTGAELYLVPFTAAAVGLLAVILFCEFTPSQAIFLRYGAFLAYFVFLFFLPLAMELLFSLYRRRQPVLPPRLLAAVFCALYQWLTYNRHQNRAPGIFQSPFGHYRFRQHALLGTCLLLALALIPYLNPYHASFVWKSPTTASPQREQGPSPTSDSPSEYPIEPLLAPHQQRIYDNLSEKEKKQYLEDLAQSEPLAEDNPSRPPPPTERELRQTAPLAVVSSFLISWLSWLLVFLAPAATVFFTTFFFVYATTTRISAQFAFHFDLDTPSVKLDNNTWEGIVYNLHLSNDKIEQDSVFVGLNAGDGTPVLVPRDVFKEHAHFLGDSGSGKTSLGLAPLISQLIRFCDSTVIVLDLKGDDAALFENVRTEAKAADQLFKEAFPQRPDAGYPFRWLTTDQRRSTFAFNPLTQVYFDALSDYQRTDVIAGGLGMQYGTDYARGYFGDANAELLYQIFSQNLRIHTFQQLAEILDRGLSKIRMNAELRRAASHVHAHVNRLASFDFLNVTPKNASEEVNDKAIDLCDLFARPQAVFLHLPLGLGSVASAHVARLFIHSLLAAAYYVGPRRRQVYLVIDEFQRIAAHNLKTLLQTARSMDIAVILANQTLADLKTADTDLIPTIRTNTRFRQIFAVSDPADRRDLVDGSGEAIFLKRAWSEHQDGKGLLSTRSVSFSEAVGPRLRQNQILLASDHPTQSLLEIRRGAGYAQYGGFPFVVTSMFHIDEDTYDRRRREPWPEGPPGTLPDATPPRPTPPLDPSVIPQSTPASDDSPEISDADVDDALESLWKDDSPPRPPSSS